MKFRLLPHWKISRQKGGALFVLLAIVGIVAVLLVGTLTRKTAQIEHDKQTASVLAQAKDALIGYAATYRDNDSAHANDVFGYLPCPDVNNDGIADTNQGATQCAGKDIPVVGRLPWKTLGLPPLRDGQGECLWYAVSGTFKAVAGGNLTDFMNWDTLGQFTIQDSSGSTVSGATAHDRPAAVIFSAGQPLGAQSHPTSSGQECGGDTSNSVAAYLEGGNAFSPPPSPPATPIALTMGSQGSVSNNDALLWITPGEIFSRVKKRSDFASDINTLLSDLTTWLNTLTAVSLPLPTTPSGGKDFDNIYNGCLASPSCYQSTLPKKLNVLNNWRDNFLYRRLTTPTNVMIGGVTHNDCIALLVFGGERASGQTRGTTTDKSAPANYLENVNASNFSSVAATTFSGNSLFVKAGPGNPTSSQDVLSCIAGPGSTQVTFASNLGSFVTAGSGVTTSIPTQSITVADAPGNSGGCLWYPTAIPLNGKTLRAYYAFTFMNADPSGGVDLGNGLTLSFLRGDVGSPTAAACGTQSAMGVLGVSDLWGSLSFFVETDIRQDNTNNEPNGTANHTAIMVNGNVTHSATNGNLTSACNGSAQGCLCSPANTFEESPTPLNHNQRIEIHTGCDSACAACNSGGSYAQIKVWTDCASCSDTTGDFASTPTASRCTTLDTSMGSIYFGFTAGFSSAGGGQGVTIRNLDLRTQ